MILVTTPAPTESVAASGDTSQGIALSTSSATTPSAGVSPGFPSPAVSSVSSPTAADAGKPLLGNEVAYALTNGVKVRESASTESKEMMRVNQGTKGFVLEHVGGWTKIKWDFNKKIGWTRDDLLLMGPQEVLSTMVDHNGKLINDQSVASVTASAVASMTAARIQAATKKARTIAMTVSTAVAKPAAPAETVKGYVAGGKLPEEGTIIADPLAKVRSSPDAKSQLVGKIPKGLTVKILSAQQAGKYMWFHISFNNGRKEGWTREDNIQF
ncbi:MAG: Bacterial SH3 domain protein [bacterium ADurb.Bin374]|nr:MAG: Bacterial SH3 domain protein [bacterium ADurb.Bin374]